jgi:hypothetical protein
VVPLPQPVYESPAGPTEEAGAGRPAGLARAPQPNESDKASTARVLYITFDQYGQRWDEIAGVFSREAILRGSFDRYAEGTASKRGTADDAATPRRRRKRRTGTPKADALVYELYGSTEADVVEVRQWHLCVVHTLAGYEKR